MDPKDQEAFRPKLTALIEKIEASLEIADSSASSTAPDNAIGRLTRMEAIQAQSMNAAAKREKQVRLERARRALQRIAGGTYGTCTACGSEIPKGRLDIMPESPRCVNCASRGR
jgi:DnaK suppressor protein